MNRAATTRTYPVAERLPALEDVCGRLVADPYRWLEDLTDPRTREWERQQRALADEQLAALPGRAALRRRIESLVRVPTTGLPAWRAGRAFQTRREAEHEHTVLRVREPDGEERVLVDVNAIDPSGLTTLDGWAPSPDGQKLAYLLSTSGNEESQLYVLDVATSDVVDGPVDNVRKTPLAWLPGGDELLIVRSQAPGGAAHGHRRVVRHRVGAPPGSEQIVFGEGEDPSTYYGVRVCPLGRWAVIETRRGTASCNGVWLVPLTGEGSPHRVIDPAEGVRCVAWIEPDGRLYLHTTDNAPRWRLCVTEPLNPERANWTELVAEDPVAVLEGVRLVPGDDRSALVVHRSRHALSELSLHDDRTGAVLGTIDLPGAGSVGGLAVADSLTSHDRGRVWFSYADFGRQGVWSFSLTDRAVVAEVPSTTTGPTTRTTQLSYRSADGTTVRMFVVAQGTTPDRPRPALLSAYGGFGISHRPAYSAAALTWVSAGGVWAFASIRGGGEEGADWHHAGRGENKQRSFDDFHAAAEYLIREGWTTPEQLAISGHSNGGLVVGAALTQRPHLYRAAVCSAPLLDMVRYERFLIGRNAVAEYGSAQNPDELHRLLAYSPYHHVDREQTYPAVLFTVFANDTRVDPAHARKMCAALQDAGASTSAERPVWYRVEPHAGHGVRPVTKTVDLLTDQLGFLARAVGFTGLTGA
jgi:prolyl oligopeptidase